MRKSQIVIATIVALSPALITTPAHAAETCTINITRTAMNEVEYYAGSDPVVVGVKVVKTTHFTVYVEDNGDCLPPATVTADLYHGSDAKPRIRLDSFSYVGSVDDNFIYQAKVVWNPAKMDNTNYPGTWTTRTTVNGATSGRAAGTFLVQRRAVATINATPEPVTKGRTITAKGTLTRASWNTKHYAPYAGRSMSLEFRPLPTGGYAPVKSATTNRYGHVTVTLPATTTSCFHYVFAGTTTTGQATSVGDCVEVRQ